MTEKEHVKLDRLMGASYALTSSERKQLKELLAKRRRETALENGQIGFADRALHE